MKNQDNEDLVASIFVILLVMISALMYFTTVQECKAMKSNEGFRDFKNRCADVYDFESFEYEFTRLVNN